MKKNIKIENVNKKSKFIIYLYLIPCLIWLGVALDNFFRRKNMLGGLIFTLLMLTEIFFTILYIFRCKKNKGA